MQTTKKRAGRSRSLTESAVMIALGTILSMITVVKLPFGGTVTACSMLPVILIAYRHGAAWGLGSGAAFALLQMLLGMNNIAYATSWAAGVAIVLLDYLLAFSCLGLAGIFRRRVRSQAAALTLGTLFCCLLRYVCHVIAGCTVWAGVSIPSADGIWYSLGYNAAYMVPETIITVAGAFYLAQVLDFTAPVLTRAPAMQSRTKAQTGWLSGGLLAAVAALPFRPWTGTAHMAVFYSFGEQGEIRFFVAKERPAARGNCGRPPSVRTPHAAIPAAGPVALCTPRVLNMDENSACRKRQALFLFMPLLWYRGIGIPLPRCRPIRKRSSISLSRIFRKTIFSPCRVGISCKGIPPLGRISIDAAV